MLSTVYMYCLTAGGSNKLECMKTVYDQVYEALSSEQPADIITHHKRVDLSVVTTGEWTDVTFHSFS